MLLEHADAAQALEPSGAGLLLRTAREAQGLHIAMLAVSLKVPVKKLEALEADRYDLLPDMVFVRALAASVCRSLKIDAAPVLLALPRSQQFQIKTGDSGLNTVFEDVSGDTWSVLIAQLRKPLGIIILMIIMGILLLVFLPNEWLSSTLLVSKTEEKSQPELVVDARNSVVPELTQTSQEQIQSMNVTVSAASDAAQVPSSVVSSTPSQLPKVVTSDLNSSVNMLLTFQALGTSWVEVVDAKGVSQLRKTLLKDEVISVTGALPLSVVVGRADLVAVSVRGKPFDAVAIAKDHVARFEVK